MTSAVSLRPLGVLLCFCFYLGYDGSGILQGSNHTPLGRDRQRPHSILTGTRAEGFTEGPFDSFFDGFIEYVGEERDDRETELLIFLLIACLKTGLEKYGGSLQ